MAFRSVTGRARAAADRPLFGEEAWHRRFHLRTHRLTAPFRFVGLLLTGVLWVLFLPDIPGPHGVQAAVIAGGWLYAAGGWLLLRRTEPPAWGLYSLDCLDLAATLAWVVSTGAGRSPILPLTVVGAAGLSIRLPMETGALLAIVYAVAVLAATYGTGVSAWVNAAAVLLVGVGLALWSGLVRSERREGLRDGLTGTPGRDYGLFQVSDLLARGAFPFYVAVVDLDRFKDVNDRYGHSAGDAVLRLCATAMTARVRATDLLVRLGGDEFLLVMPGAGEVEATAVAERLRQGVEDAEFELRAPRAKVRLTVSVGVARALPGHTTSQLVRAADQQLYAAKAHRNRVAVSAGG
jgi:diguanylate cyclase (GGDEF)-like protein